MAILLTGANGFLGDYIKRTFSGEELSTLGLSGCRYNIDLSTSIPQFEVSFEKVIHAAGLAHIIPKSKNAIQRFYDVNVTGTSNLLKGLERLSQLPGQIVFISTVAVYGVETGENISEDTPLNGNTPYALSKIQAESLLREWGKKNNVKVLILRLPLVAGANPPGNLGAVIKAIKQGCYFKTGNGKTRRSMVLAEDVASFIAQNDKDQGIFNLTDGVHPSVGEIENLIARHYNRKIGRLPSGLLKIAARTGDHIKFMPVNSLKLSKLTSDLTFSDQKARRETGWVSRPVLEHFIL